MTPLVLGFLNNPVPIDCIIPEGLDAPSLVATTNELHYTCTLTWDNGSVTFHDIEVFDFVDGDPVYVARNGDDGSTVGWGEANYGWFYRISDNRGFAEFAGVELTTFQAAAPVIMVDEAPLFVGIDSRDNHTVVWGNRHTGRPGTMPSYGPIIENGEPLYCQGYPEGHRVIHGDDMSPAWRGLHCSRYNPPQVIDGKLTYTAMPNGVYEFSTQMPVHGDIIGPVYQGSVLIRGQNDLGDVEYIHRSMDAMLGNFTVHTFPTAW